MRAMELDRSSMNQEIDLAERYLVCGMHEDAADISTQILQKLENERRGLLSLQFHKMDYPSMPYSNLKSENSFTVKCNPSSDSKPKQENRLIDEIDGLIMAACAVLIQAYDSMNKIAELESVMHQIFRNYSEIHPELFIMWISLLVSAGEFETAKLIIQEYFQFLFLEEHSNYDRNDEYKDRGNDGNDEKDFHDDDDVAGNRMEFNKEINEAYLRSNDHYDIHGGHSSSEHEDYNARRFLDSDRRALLAKIYAMDVLSNGCDDATSALVWLQNEGRIFCGGVQPALVSEVEKIKSENKECILHNEKVSPSSSSSSLKTRMNEERGGKSESEENKKSKVVDGEKEFQESEKGIQPGNDHDMGRNSVKEKAENEENERGTLKKKLWSPWLFFFLIWNKLKKTGLEMRRKINLQFRATFIGEEFSPFTGVIGLGFVLVCYSLYNERKYLMSVPERMLAFFASGMQDLFRMAFSVNLNPMSSRFL